MIQFSDYIAFENLSSHLTKIDGLKMVEDLYYLFGLDKMVLPLEINRDWHPEVKKVYNRILSEDLELSTGNRLSKSIYDYDFYVYALEPIDDWAGYYQVFMEDLVQESKWLNLIHHAFKILKENSAWELDIVQGPFISMLPGNERAFGHWVVLLKQSNNGDTFVVSRYNLDYLSDFLVKCHIAKGPQRK